MNAQCAGLIFDDSSHYLDHLAPFCSLLQWPLLVCEPSLVELCERFYPMTAVIPTDFSQLNLPPCIVGCDTRPLFDLALGPIASWRGRYIWLPHGQSDKGWKSPYFEALGGEDLLLVYGDRMREVLRAKKIALPNISIGNFRWQFYRLHKKFYDMLIHQQFGQKRFILYAPTWDDSEQNSSFWKAFDSLIRAVPPHLHLLIKVHPNMEKTAPAQIERCRGIIEGVPNISFLDEFPPIYPLLDKTDAYIGDMSSIGYDYLRFGRPMFFLTDKKSNNPSTYLMQYGTQILYQEIPELFSQMPNEKPPQSHWAFDEIEPQILQQSIHQWVTT